MTDPAPRDPSPDQPTLPYPPAAPAGPTAYPSAGGDAPPSPYAAPPAYTPAPGYGAPPAYGTPAAPYGGGAAPGGYDGAAVYGNASAYGAAPVYGQSPAYGYGYGAAKTNSMAVVALIASIAGLTLVPIIGSIVGVITGHIALRQVRTSGEQGRGMALAGTIMGWVGIGFLVIGVLIAILAFTMFVASYPSYSSI